MLWVPQQGNVRVETNVAAAPSVTPGASVTTGASSSTKGAVVELIAATAFDAFWVHIAAGGYGASATATPGSMDILAGAATEDVLIPNLLMGNCGPFGSDGTAIKTWSFPLYIPAGTRLACQAAGARTSTAFNVGIWLYGGHGSPQHRVGSRVTTYGMGTVPSGTAIVAGESAAEGAWTQITASTTENHFAFVPSWQVNDSANSGRAYAVDIGFGAATEDEIGTWTYFLGTNEMIRGPNPMMPAFYDVPSGSRLVMRASSHASGTESDTTGVIHAVS